MKKLIASLFAALLMTVGLVTVSGGTPASAACTNTKYVPCAASSLPKPPGITKPISKGKRKAFGVRAQTSIPSTGVLTVVFTNKAGKVVKTITNPAYVAGTEVKVKSPKLRKKGKYTVTLTFVPAGEVNSSTATYTFKVK